MSTVGVRPPSLGELLRRYRLAAGLTQEELAERAGLSVTALSGIERGGPHRPRKDTVHLLAAALGLSAGEQDRLVALTRPTVPAPDILRAVVTSTNLPVPPTALIGREREVASVCGLLRQPEVRLLTLTGPGGVGKTRLALDVTEHLQESCPDGVYLVELGPLRDPALVASAIAKALEMQETGGQSLQEGLAVYLQGKRVLLLLDNCEHLPEAAEVVAALLAACRDLKVLATSRAALRLRGERLVSVPPLPLPPLPLPPLEHLQQYGAVHLFIDRVQEVRPDFALTSATAAAVAAICVRLDGLPLALELAAARMRLFSPPDLQARLEHRLGVLTDGARDLPARQRTLRATLDWSYSLLSGAEQALLTRLSVFQGGRTLDAIETVCNPAGTLDVVAGVEALLANNLLGRVDADGEVRLVLLETIHEYTRERLEERGESAVLRAAHAAYFLSLAEATEPQLTGAEQGTWLARLEREHDNLRAALAWALERGDEDVGLRLGAALWRFWHGHGHLTEGRRYLEAVLGMSRSGPRAARATVLNGAGVLAYRQGDYGPAAALSEASVTLCCELRDTRGRAAALNNLGNIASEQGDYERGVALYEESLALRRELGDRWGIAAALGNLGLVAHEQGDYGRAAGLFEEALALQQELGDSWGIANSLHNLGLVAYEQGDYGQATGRHEESLSLKRQLEDTRGIALTLGNLGAVAYEQGDYGRAAALYAEVLTLCRTLGDKRISAYGLEGLAGVAGIQRQPERAARLFGAAATTRHHIDAPLPPNERPRYERLVATAHAQLDDETFAAAWAEGQAMTLEEAIALALTPISDEVAASVPLQ